MTRATRTPATRRNRFTFQKHVALDVTLMGHTLTMLNALRPIVLRLDDRAAVFMQKTFVPSAQSLAHSQLHLPELISKPVAPFHFTPDLLRNVRGKVTWVPHQHMWKLEVGKPKKPFEPDHDPSGHPYSVSPSLPQALYAAANAETYWRALRAWNELDGTTRMRIPLPKFADSPDSGDNVNTGSSTDSLVVE